MAIDLSKPAPREPQGSSASLDADALIQFAMSQCKAGIPHARVEQELMARGATSIQAIAILLEANKILAERRSQLDRQAYATTETPIADGMDWGRIFKWAILPLLGVLLELLSLLT